MKVQRATVLLAILFAAFLAAGSTAFAQLGGGGRGSGGPPQAAPEDAGKLISFEMIVIDGGSEKLAGASEKNVTVAQLLELEKQGKLASVQRLKVMALENTEARLMLGESAPMVTGRVVRGGGGVREGGFGESVTYTELGTTVILTAKVEKDGSVVASISLMRSSFAPSNVAERGEGQDAAPPVQPRKLVSNISTAARLAPGETALLCGQQTLTGSTPSELWILVSAKVQ